MNNRTSNIILDISLEFIVENRSVVKQEMSVRLYSCRKCSGFDMYMRELSKHLRNESDKIPIFFDGLSVLVPYPAEPCFYGNQLNTNIQIPIP